MPQMPLLSFPQLHRGPEVSVGAADHDETRVVVRVHQRITTVPPPVDAYRVGTSDEVPKGTLEILLPELAVRPADAERLSVLEVALQLPAPEGQRPEVLRKPAPVDAEQPATSCAGS